MGVAAAAVGNMPVDDPANRDMSVALRLQRVEDRLQDLRHDFASFRDDSAGGFVTKSLFEARVGLLEKVVFGFVAAILSALIIGAMAWLVRTPV